MQIERPLDQVQPYRGRFAPSPSGYLHFGSLITALASFLDARKNQGIWLVRLEDIDPPREKKGASQMILRTLEAFGLEWDEQVLYQSQQSCLYDEKINLLISHNKSYYCQCTRAQIKAIGGNYLGHCRGANHNKNNAAIRLVNDHAISSYYDLVQQKIDCSIDFSQEDFIIKRKDGLFAYQLAVVVDDIFQGITHVIRGCDLLESTVRQLSLYKIFSATAPKFGHIPLAITEQGYKLSKQNNAPSIDIEYPQNALIQALNFLGQDPPGELRHSPVNEVIQWAILHWQRDLIPPKKTIFAPSQ